MKLFFILVFYVVVVRFVCVCVCVATKMTAATGATKMTPCSLNRVNVEVKGRLRGRDVKDTFSNTAKVTDG